MNIYKYVTYRKLISISSLVLKFLNKLDALRCATSSKPSLLKVINIDADQSAEAYKRAELLWVQATQIAHFPGMFTLTINPSAHVLPSVRSVFFEHKIFLDSESKVLCCGTRIENSILPDATVYPMLLPSTSIFCDLLIKHMHFAVGHQGTPQTLSRIRAEYWIMQGRRAVQKVIRRCLQCRKLDGKFFPVPPHPPLPDFRTQRNRPYSFIGLDYMGPFTIKDLALETLVSKAYILMITCASSRSVHLEATRSLGLDDFIMAMDQFMNVRGIPSHVESDNAPTFLRCNREFKSLFKNDKVTKFFEHKRINWNFYTEKSPNKGGFIERLNNIFKRSCRKSFGNAQLDFEEFRTMVGNAMGVLNDRPLTYVYADNNSEGRALSPSMLTLGYNLLEPPHIRFNYKQDDITKKYGEKFAELETIKNSFWDQWSKQYITELFERHIKGSQTRPNLLVPKIGDICLLKKENLPRRKWPLCKILGFKQGKYDRHIRECRIQTVTPRLKPTILRRPLHFLVPLEVEPHYISEDPLTKSYAETTLQQVSRRKRTNQTLEDLDISLVEDEPDPVIASPTCNVKPYRKQIRKNKPKAVKISTDGAQDPDKLWKPAINKTNNEISTRVLRPRSKTLGLVIH